MATLARLALLGLSSSISNKNFIKSLFIKLLRKRVKDVFIKSCDVAENSCRSTGCDPGVARPGIREVSQG
ncbi:hypothetical protein LU631_01815 [Erwinia tracheiphila]|uniref:hypothetical protein n=1 Tax=Erwinia tracheiphila TaxID=65700 RepID=UPI000A8A97D6|nr:hypothetical protein [Erwinia tracheiphila]UIA83134.1 hypothetical protein LU604_22660 [Erwinia tracheiphila]UIA88211.1 hypothetical protein LU631_01815 [Erwinia tracheiphila]UIA91713.1 hypothetical protein LU632_22125 [Erwinia tracheiphila]UIA96368.1 hypothetical protein LU633_24345 [Erwinia tracheiphila]